MSSVRKTPAAAARGAGAAGGAPPDSAMLPSLKKRGRPAKLADTEPPRRVVRVDSLLPYDRNARTHSPAQVDKLAKLIEEFGWTNPILVAGHNILAGHARRLAAMRLGRETVPVIDLSHLTKTQRRAYILADNRAAQDAGWDSDLLAAELGELRDDGFDLALTGFDADQLDALFGEEAEDEPAVEGAPRKATCPECGHEFVP